MAAVTLVSSTERPLRSLVEGALHNELKLLKAGLQRTSERIQSFEARFGLSSQEFLRQYENDELPESLDYVEWIGEIRLLERLQEKTETLENIRFAN